MSSSELIIVYKNPTAGSSIADIILEQKEWNKNVGFVTKTNFIRFLGRQIYGSDTEYNWSESIDCGFSGEVVEATIYAYPYPQDLAFQIEASYGEFSSLVIQETIKQEESVKFSLSKEASLKYPKLEVLSIEPLGSFYNSDGSEIPFNSVIVTVSGQNITLSHKVYGTIKFSYTTFRYVYNLRIEKRDSETTYENYYSSVVCAGWNGGLEWIKVELPPGAEEFANDEEDCGWGSGGTTIGDPNRPKIPQAAGADRSIIIDYCSGELISDNTYGT